MEMTLTSPYYLCTFRSIWFVYPMLQNYQNAIAFLEHTRITNYKVGQLPLKLPLQRFIDFIESCQYIRPQRYQNASFQFKFVVKLFKLRNTSFSKIEDFCKRATSIFEILLSGKGCVYFSALGTIFSKFSRDFISRGS